MRDGGDRQPCEPVLKGWSVLYPHFRLVPCVDLYQVVALFFFTVVPYTAATIIPSWSAAIIDPDEVMGRASARVEWLSGGEVQRVTIVATTCSRHWDDERRHSVVSTRFRLEELGAEPRR